MYNCSVCVCVCECVKMEGRGKKINILLGWKYVKWPEVLMNLATALVPTFLNYLFYQFAVYGL